MNELAECLNEVSEDLSSPELGEDAETAREIVKLVPQGFSVVGPDEANWVVRKIIEARAYADRVKVWAQQEQRRAEREERGLMYLFGRQLEQWVREELTRGRSRKKSVALPAGTVGFRTSAARLVVDDEKVVLAWAKLNCPSAIVLSERLVKTPLDELMKATGEVPSAGVHVEPETEKVYVR